MALLSYLNRRNKVFRLTEYTILYAILTGLALYFRFETERVSPYWPATALLMAALYAFERKEHIWIVTLSYIAHTGLNVVVGYDVLISFLFATGNIASTFAMYEYLRRTSPRLIELDSIASIVNFIVSGFIKSIVGALFGAYAVLAVFGGSVNVFDVVRVWALAEWSGLLLLTPAFLVYLTIGFRNFDPAAIPTKKILEGVGLIVYFIFIIMLAQSQGGGEREFFLKYLAIPGLIWALFRFRLHTNYYLMLGLYVILNLTMTENLGIYAFRDEEYKNAILELNLFISIIASISLFILTSLRLQRQNLDDLEGSRQDLKDVFENAPLPYVILHTDGTIRYGNNEFCKMMDLDPHAIEGEKFSRFMSDASADRFTGAFQSGEENIVLEVSLVNTKKQTLLGLLRLKHGKTEAGTYYCSIENLSQKKIAQQAARLAEERFRYLFNNSPEGVLVVDSNDGSIIDSNRIAQKLLNLRFRSKLRLSKLLGLNTTRENELYSAIEKGDQYKFNVTFEHLDEPRVHLEITGNRIVAEHGGFDVFLLRDVTHQKRIDRVKRLNRLRLESMLRLRESVAATDLDFLQEIATETMVITDAKEAVLFLHAEDTWQVAHFTDSIILSSSFSEEEFRKSDIRSSWDLLVNPGKPFISKRAVRKNGVNLTEFLMGVPVQEDEGITIAFGVVSDEELEESDLDHFVLFCESVRGLFSKAAAELENRNLLLAVQQSSASIVITDTEGRIRYVNPKFEDITGYTFAEVKGQNPKVLKSGETTPGDYRKMWETISSGNIWRGVFHNRRKNGELFWESATISPIKNDLGVVTGYLAVKDDITLERQLEEDLKRREKRFSTLWENSLDAMRLTDKDGIIVMVNKAYCQLAGMEEEQLLGKPYSDYIDDNYQRDSLERYRQKFNAGTIPQYQESLLHMKSGVIKWVNILSRFMESEDGRPLLLSIFRDITDQKRKESELTEARMKAETMNRLKSTFLANMSHELRTPLINIMGYSEILKDEIEDPEQQEMLTSIINGGERLRDTLDSILNLSNLESNKTGTLLTLHDLNKTAKKVFGEYQEAATLKDLKFRIELSDDSPVVMLDEAMIYQVVDNLVNNALKYTSSGWVRVSTGIRGRGNNRTAFIKVEDSGIGIAPGKINVIFEPFRQGDEGVTRNYEGAGLGLTIAKKYVEMMGGELTVESALGQGSVFTAEFMLPQDQDNTGTEAEPVEKKLVLVVEDDEATAGLIRMYLQPFCEVVVVATGDDALLTLTEQRFDLAIIDINLPGSENGIELRDRIKEIDVYEDLPMIAVTAYTLPGDQMRFIEIGFNSFIEKPFRRELLVDTVMSLL